MKKVLVLFACLVLSGCQTNDLKTPATSSTAAPISEKQVINSQPSKFNAVQKAVSNWPSEALTHLSVTQTGLDNHKSLRCIKLNNYWCLKDIGWNGRLGRDSDSHTAFRNGYYAARAIVRNTRTAYFSHGRQSALELMKAYAPSSDCIGSNAGRRSDGSCIRHNPTEKYARAAAKGITNDINVDLKLFDKNGNATDALVRFLQNLSKFETGLTAKESTIRKGICMENNTCQSPY